MDSSVLFIVSSLVRELIEDCFLEGAKYNVKQIFVLTHNPYFHKEVSHKYETHNDELVKKSAFFAVKKSEENISTVRLFEDSCLINESEVENVSPVKTAYDAMWCEYTAAKLPSTLLSIIRRIIEYYFLQTCNYDINEIRRRVERHLGDDDRSQQLAKEMLQYIYNAEQDVNDGIYSSPCVEVEKYKKVFADIFVAMEQEAHYKKMSGVS